MKASIAVAALLLICTLADAKDNLRKNQEPAPMKGEEAFDSQDDRHLQVLNPEVCLEVCPLLCTSRPDGCRQFCSAVDPGACFKLCNAGLGSDAGECAQVCSTKTVGGCLDACNSGLCSDPAKCAEDCTPEPPEPPEPWGP